MAGADGRCGHDGKKGENPDPPSFPSLLERVGSHFHPLTLLESIFHLNSPTPISVSISVPNLSLPYLSLPVLFVSQPALDGPFLDTCICILFTYLLLMFTYNP